VTGRICELSGKLFSCEGKPQQSANLSRIYGISKLFSGVEKDAGTTAWSGAQASPF